MMASTPSHDFVVKICGVTSLPDALHAVASGADWVGLNLVGGPRRIDLSIARAIVTGLMCQKRAAIALVRAGGSAADETLVRELADVGVTRFQLYGGVTKAVLSKFVDWGLETIHVCRANSHQSVLEEVKLIQAGSVLPSYVLFDAAVDGQMGGTGTVANWEAIDTARHSHLFDHFPPMILAGGLTAKNVSAAVHKLRPFGVDVSSGVESRPGVKDPIEVAAFIAAARAAHRDLQSES